MLPLLLFVRPRFFSFRSVDHVCELLGLMFSLSALLPWLPRSLLLQCLPLPQPLLALSFNIMLSIMVFNAANESFRVCFPLHFLDYKGLFLVLLVDDIRHSLGDDLSDFFSQFNHYVGAAESVASCFGTTCQLLNPIPVFIFFSKNVTALVYIWLADILLFNSIMPSMLNPFKV